jgi:hypothetical protein
MDEAKKYKKENPGHAGVVVLPGRKAASPP